MEIEYEKKRRPARERSPQEMEIMKEKPIEREYGDGEVDLNPAFMNFDFENGPPEQLTKAQDSLLQIGKDGKFLISNKAISLDDKRKRYKEIIYVRIEWERG